MPPPNPAITKWIRENTGKHLCECGCGAYVVPNYYRYFRGKSLRFVPRHQMRGSHHGNFKGGVIRAKGYVWLLHPGHPRTTPRGYVKRCWLVVEQKIGRFLRPDEVVHHIDGNKLNDSPDNLMITDRVWHARHHNAEKGNWAYRADIDTVRDILPLADQGLTHVVIAQRLKCSRSTVDKRIRAYRAARKAA